MKSITYALLLSMLAAIGISSPTPKLTIGVDEKPKPSTGWITKKSGDFLTLTCAGAARIRWNYPDHTTTRTAHDIEVRKHDEDNVLKSGVHTSTFTVDSLQYKDTGFYSCFYEGDNQNSIKHHTQSIYVFVEDKNMLFVTPEDVGSVITAYPGEKRINIPCRPTSPHVNVTLTSGLHQCEGEGISGSYSMYSGITIYPTPQMTKQPMFTVQCKGEKLQENGVISMHCINVWVVYNDNVKWPGY